VSIRPVGSRVVRFSQTLIHSPINTSLGLTSSLVHNSITGIKSAGKRELISCDVLKYPAMSEMLSTLIELQRLKRLERTGWTLRGLPNGTESVGSHSFGVAVTAMMIADEVRKQGVEIDLEKVIRIALLHDWAEVRVGDMPKTGTIYFGAQIRKEAELSAFNDLVGSLTNAADYKKLYEEYEHRESLEARLVKAADVIDLLIQVLALERAGARGLDEFWQVAEQPDFQLHGRAKSAVERLIRAVKNARGEFL
jgi:5'-deoxynucleotidase YfbR-like HD superfamily hydrolase